MAWRKGVMTVVEDWNRSSDQVLKVNCLLDQISAHPVEYVVAASRFTSRAFSVFGIVGKPWRAT